MGINKLFNEENQKPWTTLFIMVIITGVGIRFLYLNQPFVDSWAWRQVDVAMIARNFSQQGFNIFGSSPNRVGNFWGFSLPSFVRT